MTLTTTADLLSYFSQTQSISSDATMSRVRPEIQPLEATQCIDDETGKIVYINLLARCFNDNF